MNPEYQLTEEELLNEMKEPADNRKPLRKFIDAHGDKTMGVLMAPLALGEATKNMRMYNPATIKNL